MRNDSDLNNSIVTFQNVYKTFEPGGSPALSDVSFSVNTGEFFCIIGPSGEGKSTILKLIAGVEEPSSGMITKPETVSMVFQTIALLPWLSAYENVALALRAHLTSRGNIPAESSVKKTALQYLEMMNLGNIMDKRPAELSGGQKQRVGIARALAVDPEVLLLDEPFSALDPKTTAELHDDLIRMWRETGKTVIMVSHQIEEAVSLASRIMLIKKYRVAETFTINLPYPRREQQGGFEHDVMKIRREFFV